MPEYNWTETHAGQGGYDTSLSAEEDRKRDLLWALQSRVLTDEEMATVDRLRVNLVIENNVPYREEDKRRELNEALLQQFRLRALAKPNHVPCFKLQLDGHTLAEGKPGEPAIDVAMRWIERAVEALRAVEWIYPVSAEAEECPVCRASAIHEEHESDCKLAALIGAKVTE